MIIWRSLKLFPHIHGYLFIFANTEIYVKLIEKTFDKFFRCIRYYKGFTVAEINRKINNYRYNTETLIYAFTNYTLF